MVIICTESHVVTQYHATPVAFFEISTTLDFRTVAFPFHFHFRFSPVAFGVTSDFFDFLFACVAFGVVFQYVSPPPCRKMAVGEHECRWE